MRKTTKDKILYILKKDNEISIKELMEYFTISEVAIRRHLNDLIREQFVKEKVVKQSIGRPYHLYSLTSKGHETFPNQYDQLPVELLKDLEDLHGEEVVNDVLKKRIEREEEELIEQLANSDDFEEKIKKMTEFQEEKGYIIDYDRTKDGDYQIKNFNCPIYNVASSFNQICTHEKEMFKNVFPGSEIVSRSCMTKGDKYCYWFISKPE